MATATNHRIWQVLNIGVKYYQSEFPPSLSVIQKNELIECRYLLGQVNIGQTPPANSCTWVMAEHERTLGSE